MNAILFVITGKVKDEQTGQPTDTWLEEGDERYLSWAEIASMVDSGTFELHSHTHSHDRSWVNNSSADIRQIVRQDVTSQSKPCAIKVTSMGFTLRGPGAIFARNGLMIWGR